MAHALDLDGTVGAAAAYQREKMGLGFFRPRVGVGTAGCDLNENKISFRRQSLARFCPLIHSARVIMRYG
jgi:hypothetical protein